MAFEVKALASILAFLSFLGLINLIGGPKIIDIFDFAWLSGGIIGVAGACVIATGLPCAGALAIFGFGSLLKYLLVPSNPFFLAIFLPIFVLLIYIVAKLGRGA